MSVFNVYYSMYNFISLRFEFTHANVFQVECFTELVSRSGVPGISFLIEDMDMSFEDNLIFAPLTRQLELSNIMSV